MPEIKAFTSRELPLGTKKVIKVDDTEILLIHHEKGFSAVQAKCPHAGGPLQEGAICNGRLVCPWHMGTFELQTGELVEPPPMEPLKCYPVRVDGESIFVDTKALPRAKARVNRVSDEAIFLLIGAGAAGAMAAVTLRDGGFKGRIVVVDPESDEPVDRTVLSKMALSGDMPVEKARLDPLERLEVERFTAPVVELSAARRECNLKNGLIIKFDRALVATGGKPKRLNTPGAELAHIIRHTGDVERILAVANRSQTAVIIGTGFIGLEAASALVQKGLEVTVIGKESLPLQKQFGEAAAGALKNLHERNGTKFRLGAEVIEVEEGGVLVRAGSEEVRIPADLVIMGVGVTPEPDFQHDLPRPEGGGGIKVDDRLRAADSVWAAGDIANVNGLRIEHWRLAQQHGMRAALGMMDAPAQPVGVPFFWTYHFGKRIAYLGHAEKWDHIFKQGELFENAFISFYVKDNLVKAVLSCDAESQTAMLAELMREPLTLDSACAQLEIQLQRQL